MVAQARPAHDAHPGLPPRKQSPRHALSSPLPSLPGGVFLRLGELDAREEAGVGKGAKRARRTNSAHESLMQPEQLPPIVSLQISARLGVFFFMYSIFFFATRRKRGEGERSGNAAE